MPFASSFAAQNWVIMPEALAVNEKPPKTISDQNFVLVLTGVAIIDLQGNIPHDWQRETFTVFPDPSAPLEFAINKYAIPQPSGQSTFTALEVEQYALFAGVSSGFEEQSGGADVGFAVDAWRHTHFNPTTDVNGQPVNSVFNGIDVDVAVRNNHAIFHRLSYHITLLGRIIFLASVQVG